MIFFPTFRKAHCQATHSQKADWKAGICFASLFASSKFILFQGLGIPANLCIDWEHTATARYKTPERPGSLQQDRGTKIESPPIQRHRSEKPGNEKQTGSLFQSRCASSTESSHTEGLENLASLWGWQTDGGKNAVTAWEGCAAIYRWRSAGNVNPEVVRKTSSSDRSCKLWKTTLEKQNAQMSKTKEQWYFLPTTGRCNYL